MGTDKGPRQYRAQPGLAALAKARPIPLANHTKLKWIRDSTKPYQYVVEVSTRNRRNGETITRMITVVDNHRPKITDILQDATDAIMESPIAAREEAIGARLITARRYPV